MKTKSIHLIAHRFDCFIVKVKAEGNTRMESRLGLASAVNVVNLRGMRCVLIRMDEKHDGWLRLRSTYLLTGHEAPFVVNGCVDATIANGLGHDAL